MKDKYQEKVWKYMWVKKFLAHYFILFFRVFFSFYHIKIAISEMRLIEEKVGLIN